MLGVPLITMFGFLRESGGGEDIPNVTIMKAILNVSWDFAISVMTSPAVSLFGMVARRILPISRATRERIYMIVLLAMLRYCRFVL